MGNYLLYMTLALSTTSNTPLPSSDTQTFYPPMVCGVPRCSFTYPTPCFAPIPFNFVRHRSP